jgi:DNA topoisomerase IA
MAATASIMIFRANGSVVKFDGFLKVYSESLDDDEDEDSRRLPAMARGEDWRREEDRGRAAFHRAAAALFRSLADQEAGRTRHRPALDLCLDPRNAADRGYVRSTRSG